MLGDDFVALEPVHYFQISADCRFAKQLTSRNEEKYRLPDLSAFSVDAPFSKVALGWNNEKIELYVTIEGIVDESYYPQVHEGDSVEVFIDTRDVKTTGYNTRFCHHFFFFPEPVKGHHAGELTRFRTDDAHELCDPADLSVKMKEGGGVYTLHIAIPRHCLHGYQPEQFNRIGFAYRINRCGGRPQEFSASSWDYAIEQQPNLWASLTLVK